MPRARTRATGRVRWASASSSRRRPSARVAGTVLAKGFIERLGVYGGYRLSFLITAAGVAVCALSPGLAIGCVGAVIYGVGNGVGLVCNVTLIQQIVPDERRGQIFAVLGSLVQTFTLLGTLAAGPITEAIGPRLTWGISAGLLIIGYLNAVARHVDPDTARARQRREPTGRRPRLRRRPTARARQAAASGSDRSWTRSTGRTRRRTRAAS